MHRLKEAMEKQHVTGYRLSKDTGVNNATIRNWLAGRANNPRPAHITKVANYLHVHPAWLLYGDAQYAPTLKNDAIVIANEIAQYGPEAIKWVRDNLRFLYGRQQSDQQPAAVQGKAQKAPAKHRTA